MLMKVPPSYKQENHLEILGVAVPGISKFLMGAIAPSSPALAPPATVREMP